MPVEARQQSARVAVVDLGTNSTRLLVADVSDGAVTEIERLTQVTRLGQGVDASGRLCEPAMARVHETVDRYAGVVAGLEAEHVVALATSAVRDADNGDQFRRAVAERLGAEVHVISGEQEARLTFRGATAARPPDPAATLVLDIGGGSTELIVGAPGADPDFDISTAVGAVRQTERHIDGDPPPPEQLRRLADEVRSLIEEAVPDALRSQTQSGIAVAGTATSLAAIDQRLERYDPARVDGYRLTLEACERMLEMLAALPLAERRRVAGLDPDRAPTIIAGAIILIEAMRAFGFEAVETSEADILHGAALASVSSESGLPFATTAGPRR